MSFHWLMRSLKTGLVVRFTSADRTDPFPVSRTMGQAASPTTGIRIAGARGPMEFVGQSPPHESSRLPS